MIGWGAHFQVSGLSKQEPGSGDQVQVRVQEIWPLTTVIDSALLSFRVAGGSSGWQVAGLSHSVFNSALHAVLHSVLRGQARQLGQHAVLTLPQVSVRR